MKPLSEVSDQIRQKLLALEMQDKFRHWVNTELIKNHSVQTYL